MQTKRQQTDDANARQDIDVIRRLHVSAPLFHGELAVDDVGRGVENAPLTAEPIDHGDDV